MLELFSLKHIFEQKKYLCVCQKHDDEHHPLQVAASEEKKNVSVSFRQFPKCPHYGKGHVYLHRAAAGKLKAEMT